MSNAFLREGTFPLYKALATERKVKAITSSSFFSKAFLLLKCIEVAPLRNIVALNPIQVTTKKHLGIYWMASID